MPHRINPFAALFIAFLNATAIAAPPAAPESVPGLHTAKEHGVFNIGEAKGVLTRAADSDVGREVFQLEYTLPKNTVTGVWTKSYPDSIGPASLELIHVGVNLPHTDKIQLTLEIKGTNDIQRVPLAVHPEGWNRLQIPIDWNIVGQLNEIVLVVSHAGGEGEAKGSISFYADFATLSQWDKLQASVAGRVGAVFAIALLMTLLAWLLNIGQRKKPDSTDKRSGFVRDLVYGTSAVLMMAMAFGVYCLATQSRLETVMWLPVVSVLGVLTASLLKLALAGRMLTPVEAFCDTLFTGLFAATANTIGVWQAPSTWVDLAALSGTGAATFCVMYHMINAQRLAATGRHLSLLGGAICAVTPFVFGLLLMLQDDGLVESLGRTITAGAIESQKVQASIGRTIALFVFNVAVVNALGLIARRRLLHGINAWLLLLLFAVATTLAPLIADFGSGDTIASMPAPVRLLATVLFTMLSQAPLWAEVYLITGLLIDAMRGEAPTRDSSLSHSLLGVRRGMVYAGSLMAILQVLNLFIHSSVCQSIYNHAPVVLFIAGGAITFPLIRTIVESFEGSQAFFRRVRGSYGKPILYLRGAAIGAGAAVVLRQNFFALETSDRIFQGFIVGVLAYAGASLVRDLVNAKRGCGHVQSWRVYFIEAMLGGFIGGALGFYLDTAQVPMVQQKFALYNSVGADAKPYDIYALVNKWGHIRLGDYTGGVKLLFNESLLGVITWSLAAWLFAINRAFLGAIFQREWAPVRKLGTKDGFAELIEHMIYVLRWGLWMSPIIMTGLRQMADPTWYNQDGAVRTVIATFNNLTMDTESFNTWSLEVFTWVLAYGVFRVLIWLDHMGIRVATLVNLSFLGMDRLDERVARFLGPSATARFIPEGVKRFTTWAPLLIPFYIPAGKAWDYAWEKSESIQRASADDGLVAAVQSLSAGQQALLVVGAVVVMTLISTVVRSRRSRSSSRGGAIHRLNNHQYEVTLKDNGELNSSLTLKDYDVTRRSYDLIDPAGRTLFVVDTNRNESWPVIGNYPAEQFDPSTIEQIDSELTVTNVNHGVRTTLTITLPDNDDAIELWQLTVENLTDEPRQLKLMPYLEWVLNSPGADRGHTQYNRLFPEMNYDSGCNAVLALHRYTKVTGFLAAETAPDGYLTSRIDFIGRAGSVWTPRVTDTLAFMEPRDSDAFPTFDPIASLLIDIELESNGKGSTKLLMGCADDGEDAGQLIKRHLNPTTAGARDESPIETKVPVIGHGEIPDQCPQPYYEYRDNGNKLGVLTPFTTRPYDHSMSNALGHVLCVTNRGLHTTTNGNSQQNRVTPDWADTVTREQPGEAIFLYDTDEQKWYSPTWEPLRDVEAQYDVEFGVDGTATFRMTSGTLSTELTTFVPPDHPTGVYLLTIRNTGDANRNIRVAPYFQITLADNPENSGALIVKHDRETNALLFENPRNTFRAGTAFAAMTIPAEQTETNRGRFLGSDAGRSFAHPFMVENGQLFEGNTDDDRSIAGFIANVNVPANGEATFAVVLGQADSREQAKAVVRTFSNTEAAIASLEETRRSWLDRMNTLKVESTNAEFDGMLNWLKYQALAERIWARRGFYQSSGAFGFRDQLQDSVNLIWVDPSLARNQIKLNAAQQFLEGDVVHWFFRLQDGRTGFACRSHAYDNLLWLGWAVGEYVRMTGDRAILNEQVSYLTAETPLEPLPAGKHGMGFFPLRSSTSESIYRHCLRAFDLVLNQRMGAHGLPLIGAGDWNDGLDEIGSEGRGESTWLGFFFYYILNQFLDIIEQIDGPQRRQHYAAKQEQLKAALENTWRDDRYLRAIHDDGTEIGVKDSGIWEIDALTAAWSVMSGINPQRGRIIFDTAIQTLERDNVVLLGWPALREDSKPYLGRSCRYPEGVRENGMYCHGDQWLIKAARILAEQCESEGDHEQAAKYRETAYRLWLKISPLAHMTSDQIEIYGGQPNKQAADMLTNYDPGRMIWNGYTGGAGWMLRQACEGVVGASLIDGSVVMPEDLDQPRGELHVHSLSRTLDHKQ